MVPAVPDGFEPELGDSRGDRPDPGRPGEPDPSPPWHGPVPAGVVTKT